MINMKELSEWLAQSRYDIKTAQSLYASGRYIYVVFMCHLAIEKALKGIWSLKKQAVPPKSHNLVFFIEGTGLLIPHEYLDFIYSLSQASIPIRYPETLAVLKKAYSRQDVLEILKKTEGVLRWITKRSNAV